ncbi:hypothetical protein [Paracoccus contaminans]|uniref:hypothetical protein n=1 Tax=Paracoccus contaminans TaxID=1945662 RepID=UPI0012F4FE6B|nr:hypothetical protein [Paracoccus contaminans]
MAATSPTSISFTLTRDAPYFGFLLGYGPSAAISITGFTITRQAATDPIAALYGTGMGQIPMDLRIENAVLDGSGNIARVTNKGGAGAMFDAVLGGTLTPPDTSAGSAAIGIGSNWMDLSTPANLCGVRLFVLARRTATGQAYFAGALANAAGDGAAQFVLRYLHTAAPDGTLTTTLSGVPTPPPGSIPRGVNVWSLIELEILPAQTRLWYNGMEVAPGAGQPAASPLYVKTIGAHPNKTSTPAWTGQIDAIVSLITDGTQDARADTIRQALLARRATARV